MTQYLPSPLPPSEPTLGDLILRLWWHKWPLLVGGLTGLVIAVVFLMTVTPMYRARMIVAPADGYALGDYASSPSSRDQSITLPFWRPAEGENVSTDFHRFMYTLTGPSASAVLLKDDTILKGLDAEGGQVRLDWNPSLLSAYLVRRVRIEPMGASPLRRLSYSHQDPKIAAEMLRKIHLVSDQMIRRDRRRHAQNRIDYLKKSLTQTMDPDHRKGITNLLMQQEHVQMLANLDEAYAAIVVEPASSSPRPEWPKGQYILPAFILIGMVLGYLAATVRVSRRDG